MKRNSRKGQQIGPVFHGALVMDDGLEKLGKKLRNLGILVVTVAGCPIEFVIDTILPGRILVTTRPDSFNKDVREFHYGVIGTQEKSLKHLDVLARKIVYEIETLGLWKNHDGFQVMLSGKGRSEFKDPRE